MKRQFTFSALFGLAILIIFPHTGLSQDSSKYSAYRESLASIVKEIDASYDAQDAVRFSAVFAEDGNFQFPVEGIVLNGRNEIREHFARQFATLPPLRHLTTAGDIYVIGTDILAVDIQVDILAVDSESGKMQNLFHYYGLTVGIRTDLGWRIQMVRLYPAVK